VFIAGNVNHPGGRRNPKRYSRTVVKSLSATRLLPVEGSID
jgi:hypothetical protein